MATAFALWANCISDWGVEATALTLSQHRHLSTKCEPKKSTDVCHVWAKHSTVCSTIDLQHTHTHRWFWCTHSISGRPLCSSCAQLLLEMWVTALLCHVTCHLRWWFSFSVFYLPFFPHLFLGSKQNVLLRSSYGLPADEWLIAYTVSQILLLWQKYSRPGRLQEHEKWGWPQAIKKQRRLLVILT